MRDQDATGKQEAGLAQRFDGGHIVTDEQHGASLPRDIPHLAQALLLEADVPDRQHFIHHQDVRLQVRGNRKSEPGLHPAGITLDRGIDELVNLSKLDNFVEFVMRFRAAACPGSHR